MITQLFRKGQEGENSKIKSCKISTRHTDQPVTIRI